MPTICVFGQACRVRPLLDAIGAQEALEHHGTTQPSPMHGPSRHAAWERERMARAGRRNNAERKLRTDTGRNEHAAWNEWRRSTAALRAAVYAVLTDLPGRAVPDLVPDPAHR